MLRPTWQELVPCVGTVLLTVASALSAFGCGTDPVNPDACRDIEEARCRAAVTCPAEFPEFDFKGCLRFYRDQCLHGLASEEDPGKPRIDQCIKAIQNAETCNRTGESPCEIGPVSTDVQPCDVVVNPQNYSECDFLVPTPVETPEPDTAELDTNAELDSAVAD